MNFNIKTVKIKCILSIIIMVLLLLIGGNKMGLHIDEIYTFGLANHQYNGSIMPSIEQNKIYSGTQLWREYTTVSAEHRFDYKNVFMNQAADVHPPLYYMLIHTVCSFFPETLGMWMGLIVNVIFALIVYWQMVWLFYHFTENDRIAVAFSTLFILSMGFVNNVVFFRMYVLLTVWTNALIILFCKEKVGEKSNLKYCLSLGGIILGGLLTQYYFAIFCFFACIVYAGFVIIEKNWNKIVFSTVSIAAGISIAILIFPAMLEQIFHGSRGTEAFRNVTENSFWDALWSYLDILNLQIFGRLGVILVMIIFVLYIVKSEEIRLKRECIQKYILVGISTMGYLAVVVKIAPYRTDRYVMNIMGLLYLVIFSLLIKLARLYSCYAIRTITIIALLVLIGSYKDGIPYLIQEEKKNIQMISDKQNTTCLYVYTSDSDIWRIMPNYFEMIPLNQIVFVNNERFNELDWDYFTQYNQLLIYVMSGINENTVFDKLKEVNPELDKNTRLFSQGYSTVYFSE